MNSNPQSYQSLEDRLAALHPPKINDAFVKRMQNTLEGSAATTSTQPTLSLISILSAMAACALGAVLYFTFHTSDDPRPRHIAKPRAVADEDTGELVYDCVQKYTLVGVEHTIAVLESADERLVCFAGTFVGDAEAVSVSDEEVQFKKANAPMCRLTLNKKATQTQDKSIRTAQLPEKLYTEIETAMLVQNNDRSTSLRTALFCLYEKHTEGISGDLLAACVLEVMYRHPRAAIASGSDIYAAGRIPESWNRILAKLREPMWRNPVLEFYYMTKLFGDEQSQGVEEAMTTLSWLRKSGLIPYAIKKIEDNCLPIALEQAWFQGAARLFGSVSSDSVSHIEQRRHWIDIGRQYCEANNCISYEEEISQEAQANQQRE